LTLEPRTHQLLRQNSDPAAPDLYLRMQRDDEAPRKGRAAVARWCGRLAIQEDDCDLLRLLVSELLTNATQHSDGAAVTLAALQSECKVLVTVTDSGTGELPVPRQPDLTDGGFGLYLLDSFAQEWGVERADGTRVWFVIDVGRGA
jgi:anti-sigma regulatory factor (Ser/Thr protein kinase)